MKKTHLTKFLLAILFGGLCNTQLHAEIMKTDYFGKAENIPIDGKAKAPLNGMGGDVFGSEVFIDGKTDVALDLLSIQAQLQEDRDNKKTKPKDSSVRKDIISGEPVTILITPDHFTQITFMREGEIIYPKRAYPGQEGLLIIEKQPDSPYLYLSSSVMLDGQTTNLFVETEEDGRIQTYLFNIQVTTPKNIREQVQVNLVSDQTPPIRGGVGSEAERNASAKSLLGLKAQTPAGRETALRLASGNVHGKFTRDEIKTYFNTMIQMAESYGEAKRVEKETGKIIYRDQDISPFPGSKITYIDPVENTQWRVREIWYYPKYDAILLGVVCLNTNKEVSMWDYSQMKWRVNQQNPPFDSTAAAPTAMQTPPGKANVIWYMVQGNRLDPLAEYAPVFPKGARRGDRSQNLQNKTSGTPEK